MPHRLRAKVPKDFLRPCLLLLLREREAHGYDLAESVQPFGFDGSDPGALYRALRKLEGDGMVTSGWESSDAGPRKRVYAITAAGIEELDRLSADLAEVARRIDGYLDRYLKARRIPAANPQRRAVVGRLAAHREAVGRRDTFGSVGLG